MNDEQQMLKDILDSLYGDENVLNEDTEIIKAKKEERKEKSGEIIPQINNICEKLEEELKKVLGSDTVGLRKKIRLQVLTSIKAEIDNGNSVIDSDGKISVGKTFDIIRQSKSEILERVQFENDIANFPKEDEDVQFENSQEDKELKNIFEQLEEFGVDLSQDDKDLVAEAIAKVNEILAIVEERKASGMSEDEAWESIFKGKSAEEIEILKMYFILAEVTAPFRKKDVEQEKDDSGVEEKDSGTKMGTESKTGKDETSENGPRKGVNINSDDFWDRYNIYSTGDYEAQIGSKLYNLRTTAAKLVGNDLVMGNLETNNPVWKRYIEDFKGSTVGTHFINVRQNINGEAVVSKIGKETITDARAVMEQMKRAGAMMYEIGHTTATPEPESESTAPRKGKSTSIKAIMEQLETARPKLGYMRYTALAPEPEIKNGVPKKGKLTSIARVMMEKMKNVRSRLGKMRHDTVDNRTREGSTIGRADGAIMGQLISDNEFNPCFYDRNETLVVSFPKEAMYTDVSMLGKNENFEELYEMRDDDTGIIEDKTLSETLTSNQRSPLTTSIVEEMTVDGLDAIQAEQSGTSKKVTLSASTMKALVESQAEARKMLEASGIIHGQTPERPTTGKTETQVAPVADSDEKSGGEPDEH